MFYCEACAKKNEWPFRDALSKSHGPCECCGRVRTCADVPSRALPEPKREPR